MISTAEYSIKPTLNTIHTETHIILSHNTGHDLA